jgi:hypothetical protein
MSAQLAVYLRRGCWASLCYRNQFGETLRCCPKVPTVHLRPIPEGIVPGSELTALEYAKSRELLDRWRPVFRIHFTASRSLEFVGVRASELWKAWCAMIYSDNKPKTKKGKQT